MLHSLWAAASHAALASIPCLLAVVSRLLPAPAWLSHTLLRRSQLLGKLLADLASMREESMQTAGLQHADNSMQVRGGRGRQERCLTQSLRRLLLCVGGLHARQPKPKATPSSFSYSALFFSTAVRRHGRLPRPERGQRAQRRRRRGARGGSRRHAAAGRRDGGQRGAGPHLQPGGGGGHRCAAARARGQGCSGSGSSARHYNSTAGLRAAGAALLLSRPARNSVQAQTATCSRAQRSASVSRCTPQAHRLRPSARPLAGTHSMHPFFPSAHLTP